jgi:threonine dehydrogenase-like Zn-dependent dehydrogenase
MNAVVFENHQIAVEDVPIPRLSKNEARVRINLAGICSTDFELLKGYHNFAGIPGHEFVGVVESAPEKVALEGRRVVADINCGCGVCDVCLTVDQRHCGIRTVVGIRGRNGVFADFCVIPISNLSTVPDTIEDDEAVFAEPLAAALEIVRQVDASERSRVAVLGDGKMGLLCALVLQQFTKNLTLFGRHQRKLSIAAQQGVHTICRPENGPDETSTAQTKKFDLVVEATGSPGGINEAISLVRPEGTIVIKTTSSEKSVIDLSAVVVNELNLIGSRCGEIAQALVFLERKVIDLRPMVEAVYPLENFEKAFERAGEKGSLKILIGNKNYEKGQK